MNDRYLFRAKRMDNGEWVEGFLFQLCYDSIFCWCIGNEPLSPNDYSELCGFNREWFYIDESTICQCTGLKDKSGKLIWENDIVRIVYNGIEYIYKVIWDVSELDFKATNGKENYKSNFQYITCCEEIEIIENIFDNPELLKE